jgi:hypothetical protein
MEEAKIKEGRSKEGMIEDHLRSMHDAMHQGKVNGIDWRMIASMRMMIMRIDASCMIEAIRD